MSHPGGVAADVFIQWKNTDVCFDFTCDCGGSGHFDGCFAHAIACPACGAIYDMPARVSAPNRDVWKHDPVRPVPDAERERLA